MNQNKIVGVIVLLIFLTGGFLAAYDWVSGGMVKFETAMFLKNFKEYPNVRSTAFIHETAEVPRETVLGTYSKIRHYSVIGNNVSVGDFTHICRETVIGDNTKIGSYTILSAAEFDSGTVPIVIGSNVYIGWRVIINNGTHIGDYAVIKHGSVVRADVPAYAIVQGNPAEVIGWNR